MEFQNQKLITFLQTLFSRRKFLIIHLIAVCIISVLIALSMAKTYTTSATILPPNRASSTSIIPQHMTEGLGGALGQLASGSNTGMNTLLSILHSRQLALSTIEKFNLMERFEAEYVEDALEAFGNIVTISVSEESMANVTVNTKTEWLHLQEDEAESKELAYNMCRYITNKLDSTYTQLQVQEARFERKIVEKRFEQNKRDLKKAQEDLKQFSEKYGMIALTEQIQSTVKTAAELQSKLLINKIELKTLRSTFNESNAQVQQKKILIGELNNSLQEFNEGDFVKDSLSIFPSFSQSPELIDRFTTIKRNLKTQERLHKFLIQRYEQVKLKEAKQTPSLQYIDEPMMPTRKSAPARSLVTIAFVIVGMTVGMAYVIIVDDYGKKAVDFYHKIHQ